MTTNGNGSIVRAAQMPGDRLTRENYSLFSPGYDHDHRDRQPEQNRAVLRMFSSFVSSIYGLDAPTVMRAVEPFHNHAWVYAGAMAIATNLSQSTFHILRETPEQVTSRAMKAKSAGYSWTGPSAGKRRTAILRHLAKPARRKGLRIKGAEPDPQHELTPLFMHPNPIMGGMQLWQATSLWMTLRGECFWIKTDANGDPIRPGATPEQVWPLNPDQFRPLFSRGQLAGWRYMTVRGFGPQTITGNAGLSEWSGGGGEIILTLDQVIHFRSMDPNCPFRGTGLQSAAMAIETDIAAATHNRKVLKNGADPGGILTEKAGSGTVFGNDLERHSFQEQFEQRHQGEQNTNRIAVLPSGLEYIPTGMTSRDMEYMEQRRMDREEVLAVMGVPKSVLSITDDLNYATQIAQDRGFWERTIIPRIRYFEDMIDTDLLGGETDNVFGAFDLSSVEALRVGLADQLGNAKLLTSSELHAPPRVAYEVVGLDVPEYPGDQVSLINPLLAPAEQVIEGMNFLGPETTPDPADTPPPDDAPADQASGAETTALAVAGLIRGAASRAKAGKKKAHWAAAIAQVQRPIEKLFMPSWRKWTSTERRLQLAAFDEATKAVTGNSGIIRATIPIARFALDAVLLPLKDSKNRLKGNVRPIYSDGLTRIYEFTVTQDLGGVPVFELDDPRIIRVFEERQNKLIGTAPETIQTNLRASLRAGLEAGEPISDLRRRVSQVYDVAASSSKTLQIARTESAGFMNSARDAMFEAQGVGETDWATAGDEEVRPHHVAFGSAGPQERGFNYMELVGGGGTLRYPNDPEAPAGEVINCRCVAIAAG